MQKKEYELTDRIFTVSNVISFIRILLIPVFLYFLFTTYTVEIDGQSYTVQGQNIYAFLVFVIASISDGLDGYIARKTNTCSKLGKLLDPIADRGLILCGTIALAILGRLPIWIAVLVVARDLLFLFGGATLLRKNKIQVDVIMLGKVATTFLYIGFAGLILAWPTGQGLGLVDISWLPGLGHDVCFYGIYFIYIGIILNIFTFIHYVKTAFAKYREAQNANR